jgi:hypothetical protein
MSPRRRPGDTSHFGMAFALIGAITLALADMAARGGC